MPATAGAPPPRRRYRLVGNLPYNLSTPILFRLLEWQQATSLFHDATVMLQREVADRLFAVPRTKAYGAVSVLVQLAGEKTGFHPTGPVAHFGATASAAHLMGLEATAWKHALGIAATQASGLREMFGTMCKPLHAGLAARNGLNAASLAARGLSSRADALECPQGFAATQSSDFFPEAALSDPKGGFWMYGNLFKYHAACYGTHSVIECARALRAFHAGTRGGDLGMCGDGAGHRGGVCDRRRRCAGFDEL